MLILKKYVLHIRYHRVMILRRPSALARYPLVSALSAVPAALVFYILLWRSGIDLPIADDYHAVLTFTDGLARLNSWYSRIVYILTFQHNEYKLVFESTIFALQYWLIGHVAFRPLVCLGDAFVLLLFAVLMSLYRPPPTSSGTRLLLFMPVSLLLFQLQYATTLNWAMGSLQNLPVLTFSLLSLALLPASSRIACLVACCSLLLAIGSSGNGFVAAAVGALALVEMRRWRELVAWTGTSSVAAATYLYGYVRTPPFGGIAGRAGAWSSLNPAYALAFIGSCAGGAQTYWPAICLGTILVGFLFAAVRHRYYEQNPGVFYSYLFLVTTAIGVSILRSGLGVGQSLASRYRTYSTLLLILCYMFFVEKYLDDARPATTPIQTGKLAAFVAATCLFCAVSDYAGFRLLKARRDAVVWEMERFESPFGAAAATTERTGDPVVARQLMAGLYRPDPSILRDAAKLGVYRVPKEFQQK
jgi:hypothetical protein